VMMQQSPTFSRVLVWFFGSLLWGLNVFPDGLRGVLSEGGSCINHVLDHFFQSS